MSEKSSLYKDRKIVLVTKHKKEAIIKPLLEKEIGCQIIVESEFDTDRLGTFSREIKRKKSQEGTALVLLDKRNKLVVNGVYESADTNYNHILADHYDDVLVFAKNIGFPEHHVIIRPDNNKSKKYN